MLQSRHFNVRIPGLLWWRIERRLEERSAVELGEVSPTTVVLELLEAGLGEMTVEERKALQRFRLQLAAAAQETNGSPAPATGPPRTCPECGEGPEVPLVGGPIFRVSSSERSFTCNSCGYEGRY